LSAPNLQVSIFCLLVSANVGVAVPAIIATTPRAAIKRAVMVRSFNDAVVMREAR
jgi:hypothetical protein